MAAGFLVTHGLGALPVLGAVFLAVTGAEALYADMGHFGRGPIRTAWLALVFPALVLNYLGQGEPGAGSASGGRNPFFLMAPSWGLLPLVVLATVATIIASQAVISGAFSLTQQAMQLGLLPRIEIQHTSVSQVGQIYMPRVNWMLLAAVLLLVLSFRSSSALASAYGIAVTGTMVVTSLLAFVVCAAPGAGRCRRWSRWSRRFSSSRGFSSAPTSPSSHDGGYVPLIIAGIVGLLMTTWVRGTAIVSAKAHAASIPLERLIGMLKKSKPARVPGTAVFLTSDPDVAPSALMHNLKHNHVLHDRNLVVTVAVATTPRVSDAERLAIEPLADSFWRIGLSYGYMEVPNVPKGLALARRDGIVLEMMSTSYFLNRRSFRPSPEGGMPLWQDKLYIAMTKAATDATGFYRLPSNRVLELGQQLVV